MSRENRYWSLIWGRIAGMLLLVVFMAGNVCHAEVLLQAAHPAAVFEQGAKYVSGSSRVVDLQGTWHEMGRQYGKLLHKELGDVYFGKLQPFMAAHPDKLPLLRSIAEDRYQANPYKYREVLRGMAETSGLSLEQLKMVNAVEYVAGITQCSGLAVWDEYAGGKLVYGRNYDYAPSFKRLDHDIVVAVYHPADGSLAAATIGYAGEIYAVNGMNEKGIFMELNNGGPSSEGRKERGRINAATNLLSFLFDADSMTYAEKFFQTTSCNSSFLIGVADASKACSYEWRTDGVKHGEVQYPYGLMAMGNHFVHPDWQLAPVTDEKSWQSVSRVKNLVQLAEKHKGKIDADTMKEIMSQRLEAGGSFSDLTVYQLVAEPETQRIWIKGSEDREWTEIALHSFFSRTAAAEKQAKAS